MNAEHPHYSRNRVLKQAGWSSSGVTARLVARGLYCRVKGNALPGDMVGLPSGKRRPCMGFSASSRRSLVGKVLSLPEGVLVGGVCFVSLTFSDDVLPASGVEVKRRLRALSARFGRAFPDGWLIWKQEIERRKSGPNLGGLVPHFHMVVGGTGLDESDLWLWFVEHWLQVNDCENPDAVNGVDCVETYGGKDGVVWYLTKYMGKRVEREIAEEYGWAGRMWGIWGRRNLPLGSPIEVEFDYWVMVEYRRLVRSWLRSRGMSGVRYAKHIARQRSHYGYQLWGMPERVVLRLVSHAVELAYGVSSVRCRQVVERWSILEDWRIELQEVLER